MRSYIFDVIDMKLAAFDFERKFAMEYFSEFRLDLKFVENSDYRILQD